LFFVIIRFYNIIYLMSNFSISYRKLCILYISISILILFFHSQPLLASTAEQGFYNKYEFDRILRDVSEIRASVEQIKSKVEEVKDGFKSTLELYGFAEKYGGRFAHIFGLAINETDPLGIIKDAIAMYQIYREMRSQISPEDIAKIKNMLENIKTIPNDLNNLISRIDKTLDDIKVMRKDINIGLKLHPEDLNLKETLAQLDKAEEDLKDIKDSAKEAVKEAKDLINTIISIVE